MIIRGYFIFKLSNFNLVKEDAVILNFLLKINFKEHSILLNFQFATKMKNLLVF